MLSTIILASSLLVSPLAAAKVELNTEVSHASAYAFRGQKVGGAAIQSSVSASVAGLEASVWNSHPTNRDEDREFDFSLSYTAFELLTVGATAYHYPDLVSGTPNRTTYEPFVGFDYPIPFLDATVSLGAFYDTSLKIATYQVTAARQMKTIAGIIASPSVSVGSVQPKGADGYTYWQAGVELAREFGVAVVFARGDYTSSDIRDSKRDLWSWTAGVRFGF